jgi:regulator of protease activity HflC (stomatin/prohibitin superfamily)
MHYVCIENNLVISVLNYHPNVPNSVTVVEITDSQAKQIYDQTHLFDVASRTVIAVDSAITTQKAKDLANGQEREFLNSTDWKVLRHVRQKALNIPTSLSDAAYLQLEQQREAAAARIV